MNDVTRSTTMSRCLWLLGVLIVGGLLVPSQRPPLLAANPQSGDASVRPLLHLDFVGNGPSLEFVTAVTRPDGRRLESFDYRDVRSAVWSPDGRRFVAIAASANPPSESLTLWFGGSVETLWEVPADERLTGWPPA